MPSFAGADSREESGRRFMLAMGGIIPARIQVGTLFSNWATVASGTGAA